MGAWIETCIVADLKSENMESHPMWVRGLKHSGVGEASEIHASHPMWVRGLKPDVHGFGLLGHAGRTLCGCVD